MPRSGSVYTAVGDLMGNAESADEAVRVAEKTLGDRGVRFPPGSIHAEWKETMWVVWSDSPPIRQRRKPLIGGVR